MIPHFIPCFFNLSTSMMFLKNLKSFGKIFKTVSPIFTPSSDDSMIGRKCLATKLGSSASCRVVGHLPCAAACRAGISQVIDYFDRVFNHHQQVPGGTPC